MFDIKMTINGKPATEANIRNELERSIMEAAVESIKNTISSAITPMEAQQITVNVKGHSLDNLSVEVSGPDDIVKKIRTALGN